MAGAHPAQRRIALNEHKSEISRHLSVQTKPANVLSSLRVEDSITSEERLNASRNDQGEISLINPLFVARDIYNFRAALRRAALSSLTPIQALIKEFDQNETELAYEVDLNEDNQVINLFFSRCTTQTLLQTSFEVLIMNCTYKTNRFKMPLLVIGEQTALHINFYIAFCFMHEETTESYF